MSAAAAFAPVSVEFGACGNENVEQSASNATPGNNQTDNQRGTNKHWTATMPLGGAPVAAAAAAAAMLPTIPRANALGVKLSLLNCRYWCSLN